MFSFHSPFLGSRGTDGGSDRFFAISATDYSSGYLLAANTMPDRTKTRLLTHLVARQRTLEQ